MKDCIEQPYAYAYRKGFKGSAPGLYYRYFFTKEEAEKSRNARIFKNGYVGEIEYRPNESWFRGYIL